MAASKVISYNGMAPNGVDMTTGIPMEPEPTPKKKKKVKPKSAPKSAKLV